MNEAPQPATTARSRALETLASLVDAGRPLIYVLSPEERRIARLVQQLAQQRPGGPVPAYSWTLTEGLQPMDQPGGRDEATRSPLAVLDAIAAHQGQGLFLLRDFHEPLRESAEVRRRLRDLYETCFDTGRHVFIVSPVRYLPPELERDMVLVELRNPDFAELLDLLSEEGRALAARGVEVAGDDETRHALARALQGLTADEARHALRRAAAAGRVDRGSIRRLLEEKHLLIQRTGVIEHVGDVVPLDQLGGFSVMKKWLLERRRLFEMRDEVSADIVPKGVLIMGVSGCGKSLAVKTIASCFELPLYRIDMVEIFSGRHGSPEGAFARACRVMEEMAPAVVWFDEIEMGLSTGAGGNASEASGELGRMFAFFLTWMQEKARGLFVAATANRIDLLPAEMIRKGRFDEVFFVDLPSDDERIEIARIHLARRGYDPDALELDRLRQFTRGWTGAEIEQCVVSAITTAKLEDRELTSDDLLNTTAKIVPLSRTMKEQVEHIRAWALERAVRASPRK